MKKQADDFNKNLRQAENEIEVEIDSMPCTSATVTEENRRDVPEINQGVVETSEAEIVEEELQRSSQGINNNICSGDICPYQEYPGCY